MIDDENKLQPINEADRNVSRLNDDEDRIWIEEYVEDRSRFTIFFQVLGRKFWKLVSINLMFGIFNIPAILVSVFIASFMVVPLVSSGNIDVADGAPFTFMMMGTFPIMMFLMAVPVITMGPAQAGLAYLLRCFSQEQPTFDWSDFKDKMKENFKQGFAVGIINFLIVVFLMVDFYLYPKVNSSSFLIPVANGILIVVLLLFLMMNLYLYPMMVSYKLTLKHLYKNAFLFACAKFLPNLLILAICLLLILGPILIVNFNGSVLVLTVAYFYYVLLGFTLPGLVSSFIVNNTIDKYMNPDNTEEKSK